MVGQWIGLVATAVIVAGCGGGDDSQDVDFRIETDPAMPGQATSFTATGGAVDEDILCPSGDAVWGETLHADTGLPETEPPQDGDVMWVETSFTCADDSGDFTVRAEVIVDSAALQTSIESGEFLDAGSLSLLSGSGEYQGMTVAGNRRAAVVTPGGFDDGVYEVFSGTLTID
jgi:hypothetical protein